MGSNQIECYFDVNIFLEILLKETNKEDTNICWKNSSSCLNDKQVKCFSSDFGLIILNYQLFDQWSDFTDKLIQANNVDEIKKLINEYPGKKTIEEFILNLTDKIENEYWDINDAIKYSIKMKLHEFHDEIRRLYYKLNYIDTNIRWWRRQLIFPVGDEGCLLTISGKNVITIPRGDTRIGLILTQEKKLRKCLKDDEDRVNYSIAKTMIMYCFVTRDKEFFDEKTEKCIRRQILGYIATKPEDLL